MSESPFEAAALRYCAAVNIVDEAVRNLSIQSIKELRDHRDALWLLMMEEYACTKVDQVKHA